MPSSPYPYALTLFTTRASWRNVQLRDARRSHDARGDPLPENPYYARLLAEWRSYYEDDEDLKELKSKNLSTKRERYL
eukprot:148548-Prymnesium_polylepis.1